MMYLTVMRHAKAQNVAPGLPDVERPLTEGGRNDVMQISRLMIERKIRPDLILTSPALRARETAEIVRAALDVDPGATRAIPDLYDVSPSDVPGIVEAAAERISETPRSILVVGHNPAMTDLINLLSEEPVENVSAGGFAFFEIPGDSWRDAALAPGNLLYFAEP